MVEAIKSVERLTLGLVYIYTLQTGKEVPFDRMTLRDMQHFFAFGTPSKDGVEHHQNMEVNDWHALYKGVDKHGQWPSAGFDQTRDLLDSELVTEKTWELLASESPTTKAVKLHTEIKELMVAANVLSPQDVTNRIFDEMSSPGMASGSSRSPGTVKNEHIEMKNLFKFLCDPNADPKNRANSAKYRKELYNMLGGA